MLKKNKMKLLIQFQNIKKLIKKKNQLNENTKNLEDEKTFNNLNKEPLQKIVNIPTRNLNLKENVSSLNLRNENENKNKLLEKGFTNNQGLNTKETLDLMESSWGEKFTKMIKDSVNKGIHKLDLFLKPKNLGKINIEISLKDKQTLFK